MKPTLKLSFFLALILVVSQLVFPQRYFHYVLDRDPSIDKRYEQAINEQHANLVFVGNSILKKAVDFEALDELMDATVVDVSVNATTAPDWYLFLKNNIVTSSQRPLTVVIFFIDYRLTTVSTMRDAEDQKRVNKFAGHDEPVFDALVYDLSLLERWALDTIAPYAYQAEARNVLESPFRYGFPRLVNGWDQEAIDLAAEATFDNDNMDTGLLELARQESEEFGDASPQGLFETRLNDSFLPQLIQLAKENDVRLVFARIMTQRYLTPDLQPPEIVAYIQDLENYLKRNGLTFIDFTGSPGLAAEHFRDSTHLNEAGRAIFTPIVAETLIELGIP